MRHGESIEDIVKDAHAPGDLDGAQDPQPELHTIDPTEEAPQDLIDEIGGEDLDTGNLVDALTEYAAARLGEKWRATPEESKALSEALNQVMMKYAPIVGKYSVEASLAFALFGYLLPRLAIPIPATAPAEINGATSA